MSVLSSTNSGKFGMLLTKKQLIDRGYRCNYNTITNGIHSFCHRTYPMLKFHYNTMSGTFWISTDLFPSKCLRNEKSLIVKTYYQLTVLEDYFDCKITGNQVLEAFNLL